MNKEHRCKKMPTDVRIHHFHRDYTAPKKITIDMWLIEKPIPKEYQILWTKESTAINECPYCKKVLKK